MNGNSGCGMRVLAAVGLMALGVAGGAPLLADTVQVWNMDPWQTVQAGDFARVNPAMAALKPIDLMAPRNGAASGFVVVTRHDAPIVGIKAAVGELTAVDGGQARISNRQIQVRYADRARPETSWMPQQRFDRLLEQPPAEVPTLDPEKIHRFKPKHAGAVATVPVWVTVETLPDTLPGSYRGELRIEADGLAPTTVPILLEVFDWTMPELADRRVRTLGWMSPEQLAKYYDVELWSDRHFELMGQSMARMAKLGSRQIHINVVRRAPAQGNDDTMVKWIQQPDGSYEYDFTVFDRYCDLAEKIIGKPFPVRLNIWRGPFGSEDANEFPQPKVLVVDTATGAVSELEPPRQMGSEAMRDFWKPVLSEMRARLEKRGWLDVTGLGWMQYAGTPTPEMTSMVKSIWPKGRWAVVVHGRQYFHRGVKAGENMALISQATVWNAGKLVAYHRWKSGRYPRQYAPDPNRPRWTDSYKFNPRSAFVSQARNKYAERFGTPLWTVRTVHEDAILRGNDGLDIVGADFFPVADKRGRYRDSQWEMYAQGPVNSCKAILGPGPDGPLATERFEAMREGAQLCEAMIFLHFAQAEKRIVGEMADRANRTLDDRARGYVENHVLAADHKDVRWNYMDLARYAKDARSRDRQLYLMAAEAAVAAKAETVGENGDENG